MPQQRGTPSDTPPPGQERTPDLDMEAVRSPGAAPGGAAPDPSPDAAPDAVPQAAVLDVAPADGVSAPTSSLSRPDQTRLREKLIAKYH